MRILIVEDEWESRDGLTNALRAIDAEAQIQVAGDAEAGFALLEEQLPDLLFLDIRMPGMDGLDMLERIRRRYGELCVVILSAYDHFPYAQRAIRLGAFDYIVKPYSMDAIRAIVEHVEGSGRAAQMAPDAAQGVYMLSALSRWLREPANYGQTLASQLRLPVDTPGRLALLKPMLESPDQRRFYQHKSAGLVSELRDIVEDWYQPQGRSLTFLAGSEIVCALLLQQKGEPSPPIESFFQDCLRDVSMRTGIDLGAAVSDCTPSILMNPLRCYHQVQTLSGFAFYAGPHCVLSRERVAIDPGRAVDGERLERVYAAIREGRAERAFQESGALIDALSQAPWMPPQRLIFSLHSGLTDLVSKLSGSMPTSAHQAFDERLQEMSEYSAHIGRFRARFAAVCQDIADVVQAFQLNKSVSIISHCIDYLADRYGDNALTQESMAQMFHFRPSYFGALFKSTTGQTFVTYLNNLRVQRAREMLQTSSLKVYDIAERCGFADARYFIRVFKKSTGMSPNQFRQLAAPGRGIDAP